MAASLAEVLDAKLLRTPGILRPHLEALKDIPQEQAYNLFLADRILLYHTEITPTLAAGRHVVCDRYTLSNYAYQAPVVGRERVLADNTNPAHLMLFCEGPLELAAFRRAQRIQAASGGLAKYEDPERLKQTKAMYEEALRRSASVFCDDLERIDATKTREDMLRDAVAAVVTSLLHNNGGNTEEALVIQRRLEDFLGRESDGTAE